MRFKLRFSAVPQFFLSDGRLPLSCGGSRKVYDLIAVNTVPSRSSRYIEVSCAKNQDLNGISGKLVLPAINSIMHIANKVCQKHMFVCCSWFNFAINVR